MGQFLDSAILTSNTGGTQTTIDGKKTTMVTTPAGPAFASGGTRVSHRVIPICNFLHFLFAHYACLFTSNKQAFW